MAPIDLFDMHSCVNLFRTVVFRLRNETDIVDRYR